MQRIFSGIALRRDDPKKSSALWESLARANAVKARGIAAEAILTDIVQYSISYCFPTGFSGPFSLTEESARPSNFLIPHEVFA